MLSSYCSWRFLYILVWTNPYCFNGLYVQVLFCLQYVGLVQAEVLTFIFFYLVSEVGRSRSRVTYGWSFIVWQTNAKLSIRGGALYGRRLRTFGVWFKWHRCCGYFLSGVNKVLKILIHEAVYVQIEEYLCDGHNWIEKNCPKLYHFVSMYFHEFIWFIQIDRCHL